MSNKAKVTPSTLTVSKTWDHGKTIARLLKIPGILLRTNFESTKGDSTVPSSLSLLVPQQPDDYSQLIYGKGGWEWVGDITLDDSVLTRKLHVDHAVGLIIGDSMLRRVTSSSVSVSENMLLIAAMSDHENAKVVNTVTGLVHVIKKSSFYQDGTLNLEVKDSELNFDIDQLNDGQYRISVDRGTLVSFDPKDKPPGYILDTGEENTFIRYRRKCDNMAMVNKFTELTRNNDVNLVVLANNPPALFILGEPTEIASVDFDTPGKFVKKRASMWCQEEKKWFELSGDIVGVSLFVAHHGQVVLPQKEFSGYEIKGNYAGESQNVLGFVARKGDHSIPLEKLSFLTIEDAYDFAVSLIEPEKTNA